MQHLGSAVVDILLGEYVQNLDQRQLELDVLNGHLLLQNLAVKPSALQKLQLPVLVKAGLIGKVELRIPWSKLGSEPTKLRLDNLLLLVGPQSEAEWDQEAESKREAARKEAVLQAHEKKRLGSVEQERATQKSSSFAARLSARVLDRLQVDITNVVIRYVDSSHGPCTYSMTLAVQSIALRSAEHRPEADGAHAPGAAERTPEDIASTPFRKVGRAARARRRVSRPRAVTAARRARIVAHALTRRRPRASRR